MRSVELWSTSTHVNIDTITYGGTEYGTKIYRWSKKYY